MSLGTKFQDWCERYNSNTSTGYWWRDHDITKLTSHEWSLGGTGSWYGSDENQRRDSIPPEPQPLEFDALDALLDKVLPNVSLLQYKRIKRETVTIQTKENNDYYGGCTTDAWYQCDLKKLYNIIMEINPDACFDTE